MLTGRVFAVSFRGTEWAGPVYPPHFRSVRYLSEDSRPDTLAGIADVTVDSEVVRRGAVDSVLRVRRLVEPEPRKTSG